MKKNTGFIVTIIVLGVFLLISIGGNVFGFIACKIKDNQYNELYKEYTKVYNKYSGKSVPKTPSSKKSTTTSSNIKEYGSNYIVKVVGVNKQLYMIESDGSKSVSSDKNCASEIEKGATFDAHGKYSCNTSGITATKLYIDESDVSKVKVVHRAISNDLGTDVFVILKDGSTKQTGTDAFLKDAFKKYKVKDVMEYCSSRDKVGNCKEISYKLTLQDGKTTTVTSLE